MEAPAYRRVLLKLSGEALLGKGAFGIDSQVVDAIAAEIRDCVALGVQLGIVIGGGNPYPPPQHGWQQGGYDANPYSHPQLPPPPTGGQRRFKIVGDQEENIDENW